MSAQPQTFPIFPGIREPVERNIIAPQGDSSSDTEMPRPRATGEHAAYDAESMQQSMQLFLQSQTAFMEAQTAQFRTQAENGNGTTNKRVTWLMAVFAMVTLLGTGGNFLTSSGIAIGNKATELETVKKDLERLREELKETRDIQATEKTWQEKMRNNIAANGWLVDPVTAEVRYTGRRR